MFFKWALSGLRFIFDLRGRHQGFDVGFLVHDNLDLTSFRERNNVRPHLVELQRSLNRGGTYGRVALQKSFHHRYRLLQ
jgi:hypothetical protein